MRFLSRAAAVAAVLLVAACGNDSGDAPADAPANVTVTPGDSSVTVSWTAEPGLTYWVFSARADSITRDNFNQFSDPRILREATSPQIIGGLANGVTYSFIVNATRDGGPAGPASASLAAVPRLAGDTWVAGAPLLIGVNAVDLNAVAFAFGRYHAVGAGGAWFTSADAAAGSWTAGSPGTGSSANLNGIVASGSLVAVGDAGTILVSADGSTWAARTAVSSANLNDITASFGNFVAVGDDGSIVRSTDPASFAAVSSGSNAHLRGVAVTGTLYVALGDAGTLLTSNDAGQTWTARTSNTSATLRAAAVSFDGAVRVAVGDAGTVLISTDGGSTWSAQPALPGAPNLRRVVYGTQFIAVGDGGAVFFSRDGIAWTRASASGTSADLRGLMRGVALNYVAVGAGGANITAR
jgi:photosystem II stability/assembly factor-like uncharacterized protein